MKFGEKHTKYFLNFEKGMKKKSIKLLSNAQCALIDKQANVLKEFLTFYEFLYSENQQC